MPSHSLSNLVQERLRVGGETSEHVALVLPWVLGTGLDTVVALLRRTALTREGAGDVQVKLAIQTAAARTTDPDDWTGLGSWYSNDGVDCTGSVDVSSYTAGKLHVRFALMYIDDTPYEPFDSERNPSCYKTYTIQNTFAWAMWTLHPTLFVNHGNSVNEMGSDADDIRSKYGDFEQGVRFAQRHLGERFSRLFMNPLANQDLYSKRHWVP